jgi:hypothetical protein
LNLIDETRQRETHTKLTGCDFEIVCSSVKGVWAVRKISGNHNHELGGNLAGHAVKRRLNELEKAKVQTLGGQGLAPKDIIYIVRKEFANSHSTAKEIYNELGTARAEELRGREPIEALVELISCTNYFNKVRLVGDAVNYVFFMHQSLVSMCQTFCTVFLLDCTYKTNKFGMPLFNVVGITSTYAPFNASFAFLHAENEETYTWALQQFSEVVTPKVLCTDQELALMNGIARVFPGCHNILCCWHINKNVLANCKTRFSDVEWQEFMQRWNLVVSSTSVELFDAALGAFKDTYATSHPTAWNYVNNTWLPHKEKFMACFMDEFPHFDSASTSRVEGNHHVIKSYLRVNTLHLLTLTKRLGLMLANQRVELNATIEKQKQHLVHRFNHHYFKNLIYNVSDFALGKLLGQLKLTEKGGHEEQPCTVRFTKSWGLPCHHYIRSCLETETLILLQDIHEQWLLDRNPLAPPSVTATAPPHEPVSPRSSFVQKMTATLKQIFNNENPRAGSLIARLNQVLDMPNVQVQEALVMVKKRGRPAGSKNKTSTTRDKSHFEYVEGRKCGVCGQSWHNSRTCPQK